MNQSFVLAALALALAQLPAQAASLPTPEFPVFKDAAAVRQACDSGLKAAAQRIAQLEKRKVDAGWLAAYDDYSAFQEDVQSPIEFVLNVHPDKAVRDAAQACSLRWSACSTPEAGSSAEAAARCRHKRPWPAPVARQTPPDRFRLSTWSPTWPRKPLPPSPRPCRP